MSNDVSSNETLCGSSNFEYPLIEWTAITLAVLMVVFYLPYSKLRVAIQLLQSLYDWWQSYCRWLCDAQSDISKLHNTRSTLRYAESACTMVMIIGPMYVFVVMMSYIFLKLKDNDHTNYVYQVQYLYTSTSAYLRNATPVVLTWIYVTFSGVVVVIISVATILELYKEPCYSSQQSIRRIESQYESSDVDYQDFVKSFLIRAALSIVVSALSFAINYGFVHLVYFSKTSHLNAINLAFALIKSLASTTAIPLTAKLLSKSSRQSHIVLMTIIFNLIGPAVAVLISSPLCLFYYIKKESVPVSYQFLQEYCGVYRVCVSSLQTSNSSITPTWYYSYECSSSYLTSYLPNFIYLYIINGIVFPILSIVVMFRSSGRRTMSKQYRHHQSFYDTFILSLQFIKETLRYGKIFYIRDSTVTDSTVTDSTVVENPLSSILEMSILTEGNSANKHSPSSTNTSLSTATNTDEDYYIEVTRMMPNLCVDITLLLTFGLASPVLAVMISCSIIANTMLWRLAIGRYMIIVTKAIGSHACFDKLERAFVDEWRCLPRTWWMMSIFIGMFWGLFVNDMLGDVDPIGGLVAAVLMIIWCPCFFISLQWFLSTKSDNSNERITCIRNRIHILSSRIHFNIWKYIFRLDITGSVIDIKNSTITDNNEIVSPM